MELSSASGLRAIKTGTRFERGPRSRFPDRTAPPRFFSRNPIFHRRIRLGTHKIFTISVYSARSSAEGTIFLTATGNNTARPERHIKLSPRSINAAALIPSTARYSPAHSNRNTYDYSLISDRGQLETADRVRDPSVELTRKCRTRARVRWKKKTNQNKCIFFH